jgi:hypothetical protein
MKGDRQIGIRQDGPLTGRCNGRKVLTVGAFYCSANGFPVHWFGLIRSFREQVLENRAIFKENRHV